MNLPVSLRRPSPEALAAFAKEQSQLPFTYEAVAATSRGVKPKGFHADHWETDLGSGDDVFARAADGIRQWGAHTKAGLAITPDRAPVEPHQTVVVLVRTGGVYMVAPCRIVWTIDDADACGFAYGTLPGHPECGEEAFVVRRHGDRVVFEIDAISRARHPLARLGGPVTRALQLRATRNYLRGMERWIADK